MTDTIFTAQVPATPQADADTHGWGMRFDVSADSSATGGRAWVHTTGRPATFFWQLWNDDTNTLLATVNLNTLPVPTPGAWMSFTSADFAVPGDVPLLAGVTYIVNVFFQTGDGVFTSPGAFPIGSGGVVESDSGVFNNGLAQNVIPSTPFAAYFFADVQVEAASEPVTGTLELTLPAATFAGTAEASAEGVLAAVLPNLVADAVGLVDAGGQLSITLPALQVSMTGVSAAGGNIMGPCGWNVPEPLCCENWETTDPAIQSAARDYAATILWAATGRRFGPCEVTVRPCGMKRCDDGLGEFFGWEWSGGTWMPYIFNGTWFNCVCPGICCCEPRCQIRLAGPVDSIVEVALDGVVLPDSAWRVDNGYWLVRTDGDCWPFCADLDTDAPDEIFTVTYMRGDPVPNTLLTAAASLACEWAKACTGDGTCRLGNRVTNLARNGITIDMVPPDQLLSNGLTGIFEVDQVIRAWNPYGLKERPRILAPELNYPRQVTSP